MKKVCPICKKEFAKWLSRGKTYCSHKCYRLRSPKVSISCVNCKKTFKRFASNSDRKYCSTTCMYTDINWIEKQKKQLHTEKTLQLISLKNKGRAIGSKNGNFKHGRYSIISALKREANGICKLCKKGYKGEYNFLDLHHIDGNHFNDNIENLICVCPNCHRLLTNKLKQ